MARTPRERSRLVYLIDLHLPSGLRRFSSDEIDDIESAVPIVISDPCAVRGPDTTLLGSTESSQTPVPVTPAACTYTLSSSSANVTFPAGGGSFTVTTGCAWAAFTDQVWLNITDPAAGSGNGTITYTYEANDGVSTRIGHIYVHDKVFTLTQTAACETTLFPTSATLPKTSSGGGFIISLRATCAWTAVISDPSWISIWTATSGTGPYFLRFNVTANTGVARIGFITVNQKIFSIFQDGDEVIVIPPPAPSAGTWHYYRQTSTPGQEAWYPAGVLMGHVTSGLPYWADSASRLLALPVLLVRPRTVGSLGVYLTVAGTASSKGRFAIYKAASRDNPYPDALIVDSAVATGEDIDTGSISIPKKEHLINTPLLEDTLYWFCWICNAATRPQMRMVGASFGNMVPLSVLGWSDPITDITGSNQAFSGFYKNSVTYPASAAVSLPVVFPSGATEYNAGNYQIPFLGYTLTS